MVKSVVAEVIEFHDYCEKVIVLILMSNDTVLRISLPLRVCFLVLFYAAGTRLLIRNRWGTMGLPRVNQKGIEEAREGRECPLPFSPQSLAWFTPI